MKDKSMSSAEAYREYHASQDAYSAKRPEITMVRDSWDGGYSVTYKHYACNVTTMISSNGQISYCGRWM